MKYLCHTVILAVVMIAAQWVAIFHPPFWQPADSHDTVPRGANLAVLVFCIVFLLRGGLRWPFLELILSLFWTPFFSMVVISVYFGETWLQAVTSFSQDRFLTMCVYVIAPGLIGTLLGSLILYLRQKLKHDAT